MAARAATMACARLIFCARDSASMYCTCMLAEPRAFPKSEPYMLNTVAWHFEYAYYTVNTGPDVNTYS